MKEIKDGNRKEKLYAKYPPNSKNQEVLNAYSQGYEDGTDNFYNAIVDDIRKYVNDGWISVEERLPENERSVLMCGDTGCIDVGWWNGKRWKTGFSHADNFEAVAWRPLPNPYRPASKTPEEMQEWKERMLRNFLRGHETIRG